MNASNYYIVFGTISAIGILLFFFGLAATKKSAEKQTFVEDESGVVRSVSSKDTTVFTAMLADLSAKIYPVQGNLSVRLRKSGWVYSDEVSYHANRMSKAIMLGVLGIVAGIIFKISFLSVAVIASILAIVGFTSPDRKINSATKKRKETIQREMGFGLERISLALTSGSNIASALSSARSVGSFGIICEKLAMCINTNRDIRDTIQDIKDDLPQITIMDEFLELVRQGILKGQDLVKPFQTTAAILRDKLELDVIEAGGKAKVKVTTLTSGFVVVASMLVAMGPLVIMMSDLI